MLGRRVLYDVPFKLLADGRVDCVRQELGIDLLGDKA